jgi:acyl-[acyl-carrier-protein] desaturase
LLYTVLQERATQINYLNTAAIARGANPRPAFSGDADPVLAKAATVIAADEAAHYDFFLEGARMYLYYFPEDTLEALADVLRHFAMPAMDLIPDYSAFVEQLYGGEVYGKKHYARDVVRSSLGKLGIANLRQVEAGIQRSRMAPGGAVPRVVGEGVEFPVLESAVQRLFARVGRYEAEVGLAEIDPTPFFSHSWTANP